MNNFNRRQFLRTAGISALALKLATDAVAAKGKKKGGKPEEAPPLPVVPGTLYRADLSLCRPASSLSRTFERGRWDLYDYVTADGLKGVMVAALPEQNCGELTVPLDVRGFYRIFLGINYTKARYKEFPSAGQLEVKLSDESSFRRVGAEISSSADEDGEVSGSVHRSIQESYWKTADLTDRSLVIRQPEIAPSRPQDAAISNLAYVKLVPLTEAEIEAARGAAPTAATKNVAVLYCGGRFSGSTHGTPEFHPTSKEWFRDEFTPFVNCDVGLFVFEALRGNYCCYRSKIGDVGAPGTPWQDGWLDPLAEFTQLAHANGIKIFTALRMIGPQFPMNREPIARASYYWKHPEWAKRGRDGGRGNNWSLAFPEARAYWLSLLRETLAYGTDGVQIYLNRSTPVVLFEEPTLRSFQEQYGVDPRTLDEKDPRWLAHSAGYLTQFLREVRALLDEKPGRQLGVTIRGNNRPDADPLEDNCDVLTWLREGLVNYVMSTPVAEPGQLQKWRALAGEKVHFWPDLMPRDQPAADYARLAAKYYAAGADGVSLWDGDGRPPKISQWAAVQQLGHRDRLPALIAEAAAYYGTKELVSLGGFSLKESFRDG